MTRLRNIVNACVAAVGIALIGLVLTLDMIYRAAFGTEDE